MEGLREEAFSAFVVCQSPPLEEARETRPNRSSLRATHGYPRRTTGVTHVVAWRKWP